MKLQTDGYLEDYRIINSLDEKDDGEYVVALRCSSKPLDDGTYDFHFAVQLSDGTWADKPGKDSSRWNVIKDPNEPWDYGDKIEDYYDEGPIYFAVKRGGY